MANSAKDNHNNDLNKKNSTGSASSATSFNMLKRQNPVFNRLSALRHITNQIYNILKSPFGDPLFILSSYFKTMNKPPEKFQKNHHNTVGGVRTQG